MGNGEGGNGEGGNRADFPRTCAAVLSSTPMMLAMPAEMEATHGLEQARQRWFTVSAGS